VGSSLGEFQPVRVAYAGIWLRLAAVLIDSFVLAIPSFVIVMLAVFALGLKLPDADAPVTQFPSPAGVFFATEGALMIVQWLYFAVMESSPWRGTLGKRALGIAVTDLNGKRISFGRASLRFLGKLVSSATFLVGYVMAGFTQKRQALHDIIASTLVVKMP